MYDSFNYDVIDPVIICDYIYVCVCSLESMTRLDVDQLPKDNGRSITYYKQNNNCVK